MKSISGNASGDSELVAKFAKFVLAEATKRKEIVEEYLDLRKIMSAQSVEEITDCELGLRHLLSVVGELKEFHRDGELGELFSNLHVKVFDALEAVTGGTGKLMKCVPQ